MLTVVEILFWISIGTVLYTMLGYPILITLVARLRHRPVGRQPITPTMTLVIPAYNEERVIAEKITNSLSLDYPRDCLEIVVVADGSYDRTVEIADRFDGVVVYHEPERRGKASAMNRVMPFVNGEIVVFTDANALFDQGALKALAANFADPAVGAVSGEKRVLGGGEGLYWRFESYLKTCDSAVSSVMGAAGECFAMRRSAFAPVDEDAIIEDFLLSMRTVEAGWRVVYEPTAVAYEDASPRLGQDWGRRTRIAAGGFQSIGRLGGLLHPRHGWTAWQYFSHRVLRWAAVPFMLPLALFLNLLLWPKRIYRIPLLAQGIFYSAAILGYFLESRGQRSRVTFAILYFCLANLAALAGFVRYVTGRQPVTWRKVR